MAFVKSLVRVLIASVSFIGDKQFKVATTDPRSYKNACMSCWEELQALFSWMHWKDFVELANKGTSFGEACKQALHIRNGGGSPPSEPTEISSGAKVGVRIEMCGDWVTENEVQQRCLGVTGKALGMEPVTVQNRDGETFGEGYVIFDSDPHASASSSSRRTSWTRARKSWRRTRCCTTYRSRRTSRGP